MSKNNNESDNKAVKDLNQAPYNPRKISDKQLQILNKSMREYGDLSGIVFNVATNNIVGGHQRTKVLNPEAIIQKESYQDDTGTTAIGYIITSEGKFSYREVNWTEQKEKAANIIANKAGGEWDFTKLKDLIEELDNGQFDLELTGFDAEEIENLMTFTPNQDDFEDDSSLKDGDKQPFQQITFTLANSQVEVLKNAMTDIKKTDEFKYCETFGNEDGNGNALYLLITKTL